ncbi:hypothetical protein [Weissella muntiaci]|uniref:hypothetical protein n=1 Tax=Weissella muntiaci TaxID=2508881 RepID=UPI001651DFA8|nr:hypothetical protein [Weissella muntiaci]
MYDEKKIKRFKYAAGVVVAIVLLVVGYSVGNLTTSMSTNNKVTTKTTESKKSELSRATVEKFDLAFFTKKDLGENRNRYKGLMTEAMYNQEVSEENKPVNQAYKGLVIDQVLKDQTIYIDTKDNTAIVDVEYTNTQLQEPNNLKTALKDQSNKATLKLTFDKQGNKYLVNEIKWLSTNELSSDTTNYSQSTSFSNTASSDTASSTSTSSNVTSGTSTSSTSSSSESSGTNGDLAGTFQLY